MAWFLRMTRFGDSHWVFGQEQTISCGIACVIMAAYKINKLEPGVESDFTEADILAIATSLLGPNPLGTSGFGNSEILQVLNDPGLNMTGWQYGNFNSADVPDKIIREVGVSGGIGPVVSVKPMIVGIDWTGGGGHWVVVDTVRTFLGKKYATVCDPWDAGVHIVPMADKHDFEYTAEKNIRFDFTWSKNHYEYDSSRQGGAFLGDVLWR